MKRAPFRMAALLIGSIVAELLAGQSVQAATVAWTEGTTATTWYTGTNWTPNTASGAWTTSDIAQFNNTGTATTATIGITTSSLSIGAIEASAARTRALAISNSTATAGTLTLNGATVNSVADTILRNAGTGLLTLTNGSGTMNVVLGDATDNKIAIDGTGGITIANVITGTDKHITFMGAGSGALTLSGANTYSGGTTLAAGTLFANDNSALGSGTLTLSGGTFRNDANPRVLSNPVVVSESTTTTIRGDATSANTITLTGPITGKGTLQLHVGAAGYLLLTGDMSGFEGTVLHQSSNATGSSGNNGIQLKGTTAGSQNAEKAHFILSGVTGNVSANTLRIFRFGATGQTTKLGELSGTGGLVNPNSGVGPITLEVGAAINGPTAKAFAGSLYNTNSDTANAVSFRKMGTGSLTLSGANSYDGTTTVSAGTLVLGANVLTSSTNISHTPVTAANATETFTLTNHGLQNGDRVALSATTALPTNVLASNTYYVRDVTTDTFRLSTASDLSSLVSFTTDGTGIVASRATAIGSDNGPVLLNDSGTAITNDDVTFATGGAFTMQRPITVTNNGTGVTTIGGTADANSTFSGLVTVNKSLTVEQFATSVGNALHVTGGITSGGGSQTITFGKTGFTGAVVVETTGINDGSGAVAVNVVGNKTTFSAINGYTGGTTINPGVGQGVLQFNSIDSVGRTGANVMANSGGVAAAGYAIDQAFINRVVGGSAGVVALATTSGNDLDFSGAGANLTTASLGASTSSTYSGTLTPNGTTYRLGGGGATLTVSSAAMSGAGNSLIVDVNGTSASGLVSLNGQNTHGGGTNLIAGTLNIGADSTPNTPGAITSGPVGTGTLTLSGGTLGTASGAVRTIANPVVVTASTTTVVQSASAGDLLALSGKLTGTGTIQLNTTNSGNLFLQGDLSDFEGTFKHKSSNNSSSTGIQLKGTTAETQDASKAHFILSGVTGNSSSNSFRVVRFGFGGLATKLGELSGTGGILNPNGGVGPVTLEVGAAVNDPLDPKEFAGSIFNSANSDTLSPVSFRKMGTGALVLSGTNSYDGTTTVSAGTLVLGADVPTSSTNISHIAVTADGTTDIFTLTNHGLQNGDRVLMGALTSLPTSVLASNAYFVRNKTDDTFQLSATSSGSILNFTGTGTDVVASRATAIGSDNGPVLLNDGGTGSNDVNFATGGAFEMQRPITVTNNGTGVTAIGGVADANSTFSGLVTVNKDLTVAQLATTGGNALHIAGGITSGGGNQTITFGKTDFFGDMNVESTGLSDGSGQLAVEVNNPGYTVTFSAPNTYTGDTSVNEGILSLGAADILADTSAVRLTSGAMLNLNFNETVAGLFFDLAAQASGTWGATGSGAMNINDSFFSGGGVLTVGVATLMGDYNLDGKVDAADYVVWRKGGSPDSTVAGYNLWRANFGNSSPGSGSGNSLTDTGSVPEPSTIALVAFGFALLIGRRNGGRR